MKIEKPQISKLALTLGLALSGMIATSGVVTAEAQEFKQVKRLGGTSQSICKPSITSAEELQAFFLNQKQDVVDILTNAGWEGNADDLFAAIAAGEFSEGSFAPGTRMKWMGMREGGNVIAGMNREWAGAESFDGFEVNLVSNCKVHNIVIPKACCNVALISSAETTMSAPTVSVMQEGSMVSVDVAAEDGATVMAEVVNPDGSVSPIELVDGKWSGKLAPGSYMVTAKSTTDCGESSAKQMVTVAAPAVSYYVAPFVGRQVRKIDPPVVGVEAGVLKSVGEKTDLFAQVGVSHNTDADEYETSLYVDVGVDRKIGEKGFIGGGVGLWDLNNSDVRDETIFIHGGVDTPWKVGDAKVQWYAEGRVFQDFKDNISDGNIIKTGFRFVK